jgi:hypothetical protein
VRVVGVYSFKRGMETLQQKRYAPMLKEIYEIIESIDAQAHKTKKSKEKTKGYRMLYNPRSLNDAFKRAFLSKGWESKKTLCEYPERFYIADYNPPNPLRPAFREIDFVKNRVGVEVQFGKYAFMVYNVAAKMTIFHNLSFIDVGVEIVPVKELQAEMSTGVSYFEQFVWDLEHRGIADIDIPVLVLGITK